VRSLLLSARAVRSAAARAATAAAWLILLAVAVVVVSVVGAALGLAELVAWGPDLPLLGERLTLTGLGELQWHLFAVIVMFGGLQALDEDGHVRVDFLQSRFSPRRKMAVDLAGHLLLLVPFLVVVIWRSLPAVELAYTSGAGSDYGGLQDRWLVKAVLPVGFGLILLLALCQIVEIAVRLASPALDREFAEPDR
jgi:TRAP-type mannitol/chloroaromatic compound transport system permease small subunit